MSELLDSERVYLRIVTKIDYVKGRLTEVTSRFLDNNKRVDRDLALMLREQLRTLENVLDIITNKDKTAK